MISIRKVRMHMFMSTLIMTINMMLMLGMITLIRHVK